MRWSWRTKAALAAAMVAALAGCGDGGGSEPVFPERTVKEPDLSGAAVVRGRVLFEGEPPKRAAIPMTSECRHHGEPALKEEVVVSDGGLENVFVHVVSGLESYTFAYAREPAVLDQVGCVYRPHVLGLRAYQPLEIRNSDPTGHNVNSSTARKNEGFNVSMQPNAAAIVRQFKEPELSIPFRCNIHSWMLAYVHVVDHPYFAVSGRGGAFELPPLPPGTYGIQALHESLGAKEATITVPQGGAPVTLDFRFAGR